MRNAASDATTRLDVPASGEDMGALHKSMVADLI